MQSSMILIINLGHSLKCNLCHTDITTSLYVQVVGNLKRRELGPIGLVFTFFIKCGMKLLTHPKFNGYTVEVWE